jgi:hypothetical protein
MPNTFHNTPPTKATTVNAKSTATLIKVILISRSTWSHPRSALAGYRLAAHERLLAGLLFPIHFCAPLPYQEKYGASHKLSDSARPPSMSWGATLIPPPHVAVEYATVCGQLL